MIFFFIKINNKIYQNQNDDKKNFSRNDCVDCINTSLGLAIEINSHIFFLFRSQHWKSPFQSSSHTGSEYPYIYECFTRYVPANIKLECLVNKFRGSCKHFWKVGKWMYACVAHGCGFGLSTKFSSCVAEREFPCYIAINWRNFAHSRWSFWIESI